MQRIRWTTELVAKEMNKEKCILLSEYKNNCTAIKYEFEGKTIIYKLRAQPFQSCALNL